MRREPSCINYGEIEINTNNVEVVTRPWSNLPPHLLSLIADRLGIIELLSFRGVCKAWQAASSAASAKIETTSNPEPWLLFYGEEGSECHLYNTSQRRYTMSIPELEEATCLASNQGWLLIFKEGSMFFYCPFSHAKIDLPKFPHTYLSGHVSAFSSPPTSSECIVAAMHRDHKSGLELYVLYRGADTWTRIKLDSIQYKLSALRMATYKDEEFHFFDKKKGVVTFSVKDKSCERYTIVPEDNSTTGKRLPTVVCKYNHFERSDMKKKLGLGEDVSISICGTLVRNDGIDIIVFSEDIEADEEPDYHLTGVWIQPRFFQVSSNQSWSL